LKVQINYQNKEQGKKLLNLLGLISIFVAISILSLLSLSLHTEIILFEISLTFITDKNQELEIAKTKPGLESEVWIFINCKSLSLGPLNAISRNYSFIIRKSEEENTIGLSVLPKGYQGDYLTEIHQWNFWK
jgi:hypothetical protein